MLQVHSPNYLIALEELKTPKKTVALHWSDWYDNQRSLTESFFCRKNSYVIFNYPILKSQELPVGTWEATFAIVNDDFVYQPDKQVELYGIISNDAEKTLSIQLLFDNTILPQNIVDSVVEQWIDLYSLTNVTLDIEYKMLPLKMFYIRHAMYQDLSSQSTDDEIVIVLTDKLIQMSIHWEL